MPPTPSHEQWVKSIDALSKLDKKVVESFIAEYKQLLAVDFQHVNTSVDTVFDNLLAEIQTVQDLDIGADVAHLATDVALVASFWSFGWGLAAFAVLKAVELGVRYKANQEEGVLSKMFGSVAGDIATRESQHYTKFSELFTKNNITLSTLDADPFMTRISLFQIIHIAEENKKLEVSAIMEHLGEMAKHSSTTHGLEQEIFGLVDKPLEDKVAFLKSLETNADVVWPSVLFTSVFAWGTGWLQAVEAAELAEWGAAGGFDAGIMATSAGGQTVASLGKTVQFTAAMGAILGVIDGLITVFGMVNKAKRFTAMRKTIGEAREAHHEFFRAINDLKGMFQTVGGTYVEQLFNAMDALGLGLKHLDGHVSKIEFIEFLKDHKPKHGPWSSVAKLQSAFGLIKHPSIDLAAFKAAFAKAEAEGLKPESFDYDFA